MIKNIFVFAIIFLTLGFTEQVVSQNRPFSAIPISDHRLDEHITILAFGDAGTGKVDQFRTAQGMNSACFRSRCDFAVQLGDNIYEIGASNSRDPIFRTHFEEPFQSFGRFDFWTVLGNHDWQRGETGAIAQIQYSQNSPRWRMPAFDYVIPNLPSWLMIYGLDTTTISPMQIQRMEKYFCSRKDSWKIVLGHHPPYSSGDHGSTLNIQKYVLPVMKKCGVKFFLAGHDHHLEHISADGVETFIQGSAAKLRPVSIQDPSSTSPIRQRYAISRLGFSILDITRNGFTFRFKNQTGETIYQWNLPK